MHSRMIAGVVAALLAVPAVRAAEVQAKRDADNFSAKLIRIVAIGAKCPCAKPISTTITEAEVNAYLVHYAAGDLPEGVVNPYISIVGAGRVAGRATVDLDRVRTSKPRGWLDPAGYLTGKLPVTVSGILHTRGGLAKFELLNATVGGVTVPKIVLQELVSYYSRTPEDPDGINLDDTFEMPAKIKEIQVGKALAHVIQ